MQTIDNIDDLVRELCTLFLEIKSGTIEPDTAREMNDTANRVINAMKVKLVYMELMTRSGSNAHEVEFLHVAEKSVKALAHRNSAKSTS